MIPGTSAILLIFTGSRFSMIRLATASHRHLRLCLEISDWLEKLGMSEYAQRWKPWERISYSARRSQKGGRSFHPQEALCRSRRP